MRLVTYSHFAGVAASELVLPVWVQPAGSYFDANGDSRGSANERKARCRSI